MTKFLLSVHVLAAIIAIGPVTVAAGAFPASTRRALAAPGDEREVAVLRALHRTCRVYAAVGVAVPVFGLATANSLGVLGDAWLLTSIALTALAAAVIVLLILPRQGAVLGDVVASRTPTWPPSRLAAHTGVFNLLWAAVTVLMVVRPGSTTGA
ncbi:hypothetical protein [Saccharothrix xinjiangensis]|uniref:Integral membrane protein DUF2269 n=1 Tax=Saccharothrix xinjiangensis TaxID=204798 RepID=A0ABV9YFH5_9PSEU